MSIRCSLPTACLAAGFLALCAVPAALAEDCNNNGIDDELSFDHCAKRGIEFLGLEPLGGGVVCLDKLPHLCEQLVIPAARLVEIAFTFLDGEFDRLAKDTLESFSCSLWRVTHRREIPLGSGCVVSLASSISR